MSAPGTTTAPSHSPQVRSGSNPGLSSRGRLEIADKVVRKTAATIASQVPGVGAPQSTPFGLGDRADLDRAPKVDVRLDGRMAFLTCTIAVEYPRNIEETCTILRERISREVERLAGVRVGQVDIVVRRLVRASHDLGTRRVL
ncbi:Asp23/Gls24 family envelope stress response protein [Devriesea agamarum]|uniref:Asp23/Gls24 family envelope stress response protein n=1 Tax=Devriesea agamarum TaxID=472569 RepID=UPI00071E11EB|nr:Asp23/Gls24 family envelope stress response protein [Devriesea agamarum]